jgi:hypothetical protein
MPAANAPTNPAAFVILNFIVFLLAFVLLPQRTSANGKSECMLIRLLPAASESQLLIYVLTVEVNFKFPITRLIEIKAQIAMNAASAMGRCEHSN